MKSIIPTPHNYPIKIHRQVAYIAVNSEHTSTAESVIDELFWLLQYTQFEAAKSAIHLRQIGCARNRLNIDPVGIVLHYVFIVWGRCYEIY